MNYLSKIILLIPLFCTTTVFSAYIMDSGRMDSEEGYEDSSRYEGQLQAYNDRPYRPNVMDARPVPQEERFTRYPSQDTPGTYYHPGYGSPYYEPEYYRYKGGHRVFSPDPNQPPQFDQAPYPYPPTDYDNKNRRWLSSNDNRETSWEVAELSAQPKALQHPPLSDDGISQKLRQSLKHDPMLHRIVREIEVNVDGGIVTLTGVVHNQAEKNKIDYIARSTEGVKDVTNKIIIENKK